MESGPFSIAGAFNTVKRTVIAGPGNRINIAFPFSAPAASNSNSFAPTTFAGGNRNNLSGSLTNSSKQFRSSLKKLSAGVQKALGGLGKKKQPSEPKTAS